jgi:hypothetical protein
VTTPSVNSCKDSNSTICSIYASAGYCATYTSVQNYCPLSCKMCKVTSTTTISVCKDSDSKICPQYYKAGYCSLYTSVQNYCPLSCKLCTISTTPSSLSQSLTSFKCSDTSSQCKQYISLGFCTNSMYQSLMQNLCPLSCNLCSTSALPILSSTKNLCQDKNSTLCIKYAAVGYCSIYTSVKNYCPFSCNSCTISTSIFSIAPTSSPLLTNNPCEDKNLTLCSQYAAVGFCASYTSVQNHCPFSCSLCTTVIPLSSTTNQPTSIPCKDSNSTICPLYAAAGYCESYTSVQNYCPFSCRLCTRSSQCNDLNSSDCRQLASLGFCTSGSYKSLMKNYCPVTCNSCSTYTPPSATTKCSDADSTQCKQFALLGFCSGQYQSTMRTICPVSCKSCKT